MRASSYEVFLEKVFFSPNCLIKVLLLCTIFPYLYERESGAFCLLFSCNDDFTSHHYF